MTEDRRHREPHRAADRVEEGLLPADPERDDVPTVESDPRRPRTAAIVTGLITVVIVAAIVLAFGAVALDWFQY